jgi:hypothetical protein
MMYQMVVSFYPTTDGLQLFGRDVRAAGTLARG